MTARQQRRLQQRLERKAQKLELRHQVVSEAKLTANRANAQFSTGPTSAEGKAIVSQNRTRHGLTGAFRVMPRRIAGQLRPASRFPDPCRVSQRRNRSRIRPADGRSALALTPSRPPAKCLL